MMARKISRGHESQSVGHTCFGKLGLQKGAGVDLGWQVAVAYFDPDHIAHRRETRMEQRPAERSLRFKKRTVKKGGAQPRRNGAALRTAAPGGSRSSMPQSERGFKIASEGGARPQGTEGGERAEGGGVDQENACDAVQREVRNVCSACQASGIDRALINCESGDQAKSKAGKAVNARENRTRRTERSRAMAPRAAPQAKVLKSAG